MIDIDKTELYYKHLILAFYLGAFEMIFRGLLRKVGLELIATISIQGYIYILPFFFLFVCFTKQKTDSNSKFIYFLIFIQVLYLMIIVAPFSIGNGLIRYFFLGLKNYYLPFLYFIILYYLVEKKKDFPERFLGHIVRIGIIYGVYTIFEVISLYYWQNSLLLFFNSLAYNPGVRSGRFLTHIKRSVGLYGSMQVNGLFFAILTSFCMHGRFKLHKIDSKYLFYFFLFCLLISSAKTYIIAFLLYFVISIVFSLKSKKYATCLCLFLLFIFGFFVVYPNIPLYGISVFFSGYSNSRVDALIVRMMEKYKEYDWFLKESIFPKGFLPTVYLDPNINIPEKYLDQEVFLYRLSYQIGILGSMLWIFTIFRPIFTTKIRWIFKSEYAGMFFIAIFGFIHYVVIHTSFLFLIAIFCNIMALEQKNQSKINLCINGLGVGNASRSKLK